MRRLVYTCVFGGYDRVFPPVRPEPDLDYVIVTEDAGCRVPGWRTHLVDPSGFATPKAANLHYRALIHRELPGYDASLYVDGNIRLKGRTSAFFEPFLQSGAALGLFPHSQRGSVAQEVAFSTELGKIARPQAAEAELNDYLADGFPDDQGLVETGIILKNHNAPDLDPAMALWAGLFATYLARDQISLPYVLWKTGVSCHYHDFSLRDPNPWFGLYPHRSAPGVRPAYADLAARAHGSLPHRVALGAWHMTWAVRRALRRARNGGRT